MRKCFTIIVIIFYLGKGYAQYANFYFSAGGGACTFSSGWSIYGSLTFEKKSHVGCISGLYGSESGNRTPGFLYSASVNDNFSELAILYGRCFRPSKLVRLTAMAGPSKYNYNDRSLGPKTGSFFSYHTVKSKYYEGYSLATKGELLLTVSEGFGVGFDVLMNFNDKIFFGAFLINLSFGIVDNDGED